MSARPLSILVVAPALGPLGSGKAGGVELTLVSVVSGLLERGHRLTVAAAEGSSLPPSCQGAALLLEPGAPQESCQHAPRTSDVWMPAQGLLPRLWQRPCRSPSMSS